MFSRKIGIALGLLLVFLTIVAFVMGRPAPRNKRIYPIVSHYAPFTVEKTLGGLRILRKDDPKFKEEPDAVDFYSRLHTLEREWAKKHLKLDHDRLLILNDQGKVLKEVPLKNEREKRFVKEYYGVQAP